MYILSMVLHYVIFNTHHTNVAIYEKGSESFP